MVGSIASALPGTSLSWSTTGKDTNGDGLISLDEYMAPVSGSACVPADMANAPTLQEMFSAFDINQDGFLSVMEVQGPKDVQHAKAPSEIAAKVEQKFLSEI